MIQSVDECPDCGARMVQRSNRKTGEKFWGCSQYPNCTATRPMHDGDAPSNSLPSERVKSGDKRRWERE